MMNSSLLPSNNNSNSCMERYVNRYVVHQQPPPPSHHQPVHSQRLQSGTAPVVASAVAAGYYQQPANIHHQHHPHHHHQQHQHQQQQHQNQFITLSAHNHSVQHPNPSVPATPATHPTGGAAGGHGVSSNYMAGCYSGAGTGGASGWTGVPLISTASSNRRQRKHFTGSGGTVNNGNHYPYQQHLAQQQQHYNLPKGTTAGVEFDENANLTRLALHAQGAPLILSTNRYHHSHHRNHKSSSSASQQTAGCGVGSAKAFTSGGSQSQPESSTNCLTRSSTQPLHPGLGSNGGQRRPLDAHLVPVGAAGQSSGGVIKSYESVVSLESIPSSGNTSSPPTVMSGSAMASSVSSASSSSFSTSSTTSSSSTEMCLPRIIKPRKRRKKDRKPSAQPSSGSNGGAGSAGNGTEGSMCVVADDAASGCAVGGLPCMESLNVIGGTSVQAMNNILLQHQQSQLHYGSTSMEPLGGVPNVRDILNELCYIASHNPSVLFPEQLTAELAKILAGSNAAAARYQSQPQQQLLPRQQCTQLHRLLLQLQQNHLQHQQQQQLQHQRILQAQQQQLPSQHDQHQQLLYQQHHQQQYLTHAHFLHNQQQQTREHQVPLLSTAYSPGSESGDSSPASFHPPAALPGIFFASNDVNAAVPESVQEHDSNTLPSCSPSLPLSEPISPSASSNCSCRLCDPFGRIWAFPMLRQASCSSADGFEPEERKKNVGVIGSNRNSGAAVRGKWCTSTESAPIATITIGDSADECLSRKGSFSDSGSDSGCDLLLNRLPGLCSTEEEEDEDEENDDQGGSASEVEKGDSFLVTVKSKDPFARHYGNLPWLSSIVGQPVGSSTASPCLRKTNDDELLLMSELTKQLHETLDLDGETCKNQESFRMQKDSGNCSAPRSGSCSSSSSSSSSSTSDKSSGMGSLLGGDSPSTISPNAFGCFDALSHSNVFGEHGSIRNRLLVGGDRLFDPRDECLVISDNNACTSEMLHMVSLKMHTESFKSEDKEVGLVDGGNGGASDPEENGSVLQESDFVQCEKRNPLSLRPISVVSSLFSANQQSGAATTSKSWSSAGEADGGNFLYGREQQQQEHTASSFLLPSESQDHAQRYRQSSNGSIGDMLNCFDTVWSGGDHKQIRS
uniref:Uncharacterized protein n=1 Tax=Anopheles coluzzii TaxID=1518534 RepID=A0A6E8W6K7_ANOCL